MGARGLLYACSDALAHKPLYVLSCSSEPLKAPLFKTRVRPDSVLISTLAYKLTDLGMRIPDLGSMASHEPTLTLLVLVCSL